MDSDPLTLLREDGAHALRNVPAELFAGKRVLVTGASGLVGTHFLAGLVELQRRVAVDLRIDAVVHKSIPSHIEALAHDSTVQFYRGDLCDGRVLAALPEADIIVHAATYGQPGLFAVEPEKTLRLNTVGTFALLDKLSAKGKFLFLSTSELYSGLTNPPYTEEQIGTTNTNHPRSCYIEGKRSGEAICQAYRARGIDAKSARLSLAYGPGTRREDRRVINMFIEKALCTGEIRLLDRGFARRTYCYVGDAVEMMWNILLQGRESIYNVGGISRTTIAELASQIGASMNVPVIVPESDEAAVTGAPDEVRLDVSRYEREFGRMHFVPFGIGLERTITWQRDALFRRG